MNLKKIALLLIGILILNSCATIINGKKAAVNISADQKGKIVFQNDTIVINTEQTTIRPIRSKKPLEFKVIKDSLQENFSFNSKVSPLFWANIFNNYGIGMLVDFTNDNRFTYNHNLHFVTDSITNTIELSNKKIAIIPKNKIFIYTSPLQFLDFFSIPIATIGSEYFIRNNFSIGLEYGFRNSIHHPNSFDISYLKEKAMVKRLELKMYNIINLTNNVHSNEYISLEFREIKSQYNDQLEYTLKDNSLQNQYIVDDFATKKTVGIFNLKYGLLVPIGTKFYFDFYSGIGVRIKKFNHLNLEFDNSKHEIYYHDDLTFFDFTEFKNYTEKSFLNYSLGFKFGIKL